MILPDSSTWIDFLRSRGDRQPAVQTAIDQGLVAVCEPVWAEMIAGARDDRHQRRMERFLASFPMVSTEFADWENAATIRRLSRRQGRTIRSFTDCLIAGIAIRRGMTVLHNDSDFELIAEVLPLLDQTRG